MAAHAMTPHGQALLAWYHGDAAAQLVTRRDDGFTFPIPVGHFFRDPPAFTALERAALGGCRGRVLDIGAGSGLHTLALQERGFDVTAIDVAAECVEIMQGRGVRDARCADVMDFADGPFNTLLLLGHGIGMAGTLEGLARFLDHAASILQPDGHLLLDSVDVRATDDPRHLAYHDACRRAGRYEGEVMMQLAFEDVTGPMCSWLHVDPGTLDRIGTARGWRTDVLVDAGHGEYLAGLTREGGS